MSGIIAPDVTTGTFTSSATASISASGAPITVYGVIIANKDGTDKFSVDFQETTSGNTSIFQVALGVNSTVTIEFPWRADKGLQLVANTTDANLTYAVFHSSTTT